MDRIRGDNATVEVRIEGKTLDDRRKAEEYSWLITRIVHFARALIKYAIVGRKFWQIVILPKVGSDRRLS